MRVPREYPTNGLAPKALNNAGAVLEKAKKPEEACAAYKELADKYPSASEAPDALFTAARIEENVAYYDRAAVLYEQLATKYPQNPHAADALRSAGVLRQSLGQHDRAIKHYGEYARRYKDSSDAKDVAFQAAVGARGSEGLARCRRQLRRLRARATPATRAVVEALAREADAHLKAGNDNGAKDAAAEGAVGVWRRRQTRRQAADRRAPRTRTTTRRRPATSRASSSTATTRGSRSRASRASWPRCWRRRPSGSKRRSGIYLDVVTYRSPEWATAGAAAHRAGLRGVRQGDAQRARAEGSQRRGEADLPRRAGEGGRRDRGQGARRVQVRLRASALQIGVYNKHTQTIRQALSRLAENEYPKEAELRLCTRPGEPRIALDRMEEVRRDQ